MTVTSRQRQLPPLQSGRYSQMSATASPATSAPLLAELLSAVVLNARR
jgi:hypothetical protein